MRYRLRLLLLTSGLLAGGHGCGGRSTLNGESNSSGGARSSGGSSSGGRNQDGSGGRSNAGGGAAVGGSDVVGAGGDFVGAGGDVVGAGGDLGGAGGSLICDPVFECKGPRATWLMFSSWSMASGLPVSTSCVDYNEDGWLDMLDYIYLSEHWWEDCPAVGPLAQAGACPFPGDLNQNRCLDWEDYALIEAQFGLTGAAATPCSDVDESGYVDELDLTRLLHNLSVAGCPGLPLEPTQVIPGYTGQAYSCEDAALGHLNRDNEVDVRDLDAVLAYFALPPDEANACMDVDRDDKIDLADALHVLSRRTTPTEEETCQETLDELEAMVDSSKACVTDDDCQIIDAGCSHVAEHCGRAVYLNHAVGQDAWQRLTDEATDCIGSSQCRRCDEAAPDATCVMGRCGH